MPTRPDPAPTPTPANYAKVHGKGVEPLCLAAAEPKSAAYANFATRADVRLPTYHTPLFLPRQICTPRSHPGHGSGDWPQRHFREQLGEAHDGDRCELGLQELPEEAPDVGLGENHAACRRDHPGNGA